MFRHLLLPALLLFSLPVLAQVPSRKDLTAAILPIYKNDQAVFKSWKGKKLPGEEGLPTVFASLKNFIGTTNGKIVQRSNDETPPVYFYKAQFAKSKTADEVIKLASQWKNLVDGIPINASESLLGYSNDFDDETKTSERVFAVLNTATIDSKYTFDKMFRVHVLVEKDEEGFYYGILQIGRP